MFEDGRAAERVMSRVAELLPLAPGRFADQQLIEAIELVERLGRHVDAMKLSLAHELAVRSEGGPGEESLAHKLGHRGAKQALEMVTRSSAREAARRVKTAERLRAFPLVDDALAVGEIGIEHAEAITGALGGVLHVAPADAVSIAESALVESAKILPADLVCEQAKLWGMRLDQDGAEPTAELANQKRFFTIGKVADGLAKVSGLLPAEHAATIQQLLDAVVNPRAKVAFDDAEQPNAPSDHRTAGQKRADALRDICAAQARADQTPQMGGDHPTVWITTTEAELAGGHGLAWLDGVSEAVPVSVAEQAACTGGIQEVVFNDDGDILRLGRTRRGFTHRQRRAIALRDGNTCIIPGCSTPVKWCELHHVRSYQDGGETDVGNGVHLCFFHHSEVDAGPWRIRMIGGRPQVRWIYGSHASPWDWVNTDPITI